MRQFISVHDAHCCPIHGCKYCDDFCPVEEGLEEGLRCESCDFDDNGREKYAPQQARALEKVEDIIRNYDEDHPVWMVASNIRDILLGKIK